MNKGIDTTIEDYYNEHVIIKTKRTFEAFRIGYNAVHDQSVNKAIEIGKEIARRDKEEENQEDDWLEVVNNKKG